MMPILLLLFSIAQLYIGTHVTEKYSPAWFFVIMWMSQLFFTAIFFSRYIDFEYSGLFYIIFITFFFSLGGMLLRGVGTHRLSGGGKILDSKRVPIILSVLLVLSCGSAVYAIVRQGYDLMTLINMNMLLEMNSEMAENRYHGESNVSFFSQLLLVFNYLTPLYGGYCYRLVKKKKVKTICVLSIFPSLFVALTQATKMGFMTAVLLFVVGVLVCSYSNRLSIVISKKQIVKYSGMALCFFLILYLTMMFRLGRVDEEASQIASSKMYSYAIGHLACFDKWYSLSTTEDLPYKLGVRTFFGLSNALGIEKRESGIYDETVFFGKGEIQGNSNVYTAFRPLVEDYGILGSMVFMIIFGFLSQLCIVNIRQYRRAYLSETILCAIFAWVFWSFVTSFFSYLSYFAMFFFFFLLLKLTYKPQNRLLPRSANYIKKKDESND